MHTIITATKQDIPLICELAEKTWMKTYVPIIGIEQVNYMLQKFYSPDVLAQQMDDENHFFVIAYMDNLPVGFAAWSLVEPAIFKLHKLYVLPETQGNGVGKTMIKFMIRFLRLFPSRNLILNVNRHNEKAIQFYHLMGFSILRQEDIDIGDGYFMNDYVMGLSV